MAASRKAEKKQALTDLKAKQADHARSGQVKAGQKVTPRDGGTGLPTGKRQH